MLKLKLLFYFQHELCRNSHIEINFVAHVQKRNCYSIAGNCYEDSNNDPLVIMHPEGNIYLMGIFIPNLYSFVLARLELI